MFTIYKEPTDSKLPPKHMFFYFVSNWGFSDSYRIIGAPNTILLISLIKENNRTELFSVMYNKVRDW